MCTIQSDVKLACLGGPRTISGCMGGVARTRHCRRIAMNRRRHPGWYLTRLLNNPRKSRTSSAYTIYIVCYRYYLFYRKFWLKSRLFRNFVVDRHFKLKIGLFLHFFVDRHFWLKFRLFRHFFVDRHFWLNFGPFLHFVAGASTKIRIIFLHQQRNVF